MDVSAERFMRRAIDLSRGGYPAPNPHVGCVIVKDGVVVGEGYHDHAGAPHAEAVALEQAAESARGAVCYVSLEPCNHHGRTPPCAQALVDAGVREVFIAATDPNPKATGGIQRLRDAGIPCRTGVLEEEAEEVNRVFLTAQRRKRPYVVLKAAMTLDGFVAREDGSSKWITSPLARERGHVLRAELGCVLVGRKTVETDDPSLTARIPGVVNQPVRVVLDPRGKVPASSRVFNDGHETVWVVQPGVAHQSRQMEVPFGSDGFDLVRLLQLLWDRGVVGLLVEGGAETFRAFLRSGLVDRLELFVAPVLFGSGRALFDHSCHGAVRLKSVACEAVDVDVRLTYDVVRAEDGT